MRKIIIVLFVTLATASFAQTHVAEKHYSTKNIQLKDVEISDIVDTISSSSTDSELPTAKSVYDFADAFSADLSEFEYIRAGNISPDLGEGYYSNDTICIHKTDNRGIGVSDALIGSESLTVRTATNYTSYPILEIKDNTSYFFIIIDQGGKGSVPEPPMTAKVYMSFTKSSTELLMGYEFLYDGGTYPPQEGEINVIDGIIRLNKSDKRGVKIYEVVEMATHIRIREDITVHVYDISSITEETMYYTIYIAYGRGDPPVPAVATEAYISFLNAGAELNTTTINIFNDVDTTGAVEGSILKYDYDNNKFVTALPDEGGYLYIDTDRPTKYIGDGVTLGNPHMRLDSAISLLLYAETPPRAYISGNVSNPLEKGSTTNIQLSWTATRTSLPITAITVVGESVTPTGDTQSGTKGVITSEVGTSTYSISVTSGTMTASASVGYSFYNRLYMGMIYDMGNPNDTPFTAPNGNPASLYYQLTDAFILNTANFPSNTLRTSYPSSSTSLTNSGDSPRLVVVAPTSFGEPQISTDGGSLYSDLILQKKWDFTNQHGYTEEFQMWVLYTVQTAAPYLYHIRRKP